MTYLVAVHSVRGMLNHDRYEVPRYQRGYAWTSTQVSQFCGDLKDSMQKDRHFFGTIYIDGNDKILDGQQRTTTVFLFLLATKDYLKTKDAKECMIKDLEKYLLNGTKPKLSLSKFNSEYFQKLVNDSPSAKRPPNELENDSKILRPAGEYEKETCRIFQNGEVQSRLVHIFTETSIVGNNLGVSL